MLLIVVVIVAVMLVVVIGVFEHVGSLVERKARERFKKATPGERFKYQSEMRKAEM